MVVMGRVSILICKSAAEESDGVVWRAVTRSNHCCWVVMLVGEFRGLNPIS